MVDNKFDDWSKNFHKVLFEKEPAGKLTGKDISGQIKELKRELQELFRCLLEGESCLDYGERVFFRARKFAINTLNEDDKDVKERAYYLGVTKNHDYGPTNILDYGATGVVVRMNDKLSRIENLIHKKNDAKVKDEKLEDTLLDIVNYATYGIMLLRKVWS